MFSSIFSVFPLLHVQVHVKSNQTIKQALKKAMHTRDLSSAQCVAYVMRPNNAKVAVDWNTGSSFLAGSEVHLINLYFLQTPLHCMLLHKLSLLLQCIL